ncbi:hypothetical protein P7228_03090 [Altererythrobacter arenosus]|uniref:Uncharacterized protein n=1 Tax=Altererythrobacter arenosus TaxID=3032592 RepID=A0ABY8FUY1_9SPHN|nr:hypothetical protein [Altererythrobacter sp. CAU 1644]WFL78070.1 hypothetical protein P7228_03090 [Altererythrobacter sp. CAU 1644]
MNWKVILGAGALAFAAPASAETLDNETVVMLTEVGLGEEAIVAKIQQTPGSYDVTTDALIALKQKGVSSVVIAAMIEASNSTGASMSAAASIDSPDPLVPHPPGVYLLADWSDEPRMHLIDATTSNQTKTGGFLGYALTGGIASMSFKTVVPNSSARIAAKAARPTFYFYFDQASSSLSNRGGASFWDAGAVTSPAEFSLVRFKVRSGRREAKVGKFNLGGAKAGVMEKDQIPFDYERVAPGVFKVRPQVELERGEYGFIYSTAAGGGPGISGVGATTSRIFDFSVGG